VLLTGVIRSGSTLTCALLNKLPNTVAADEPLLYRDFHGLKGAQFLNYIDQEFSEIRRLAITEKILFSGQVQGKIEQHYSDTLQADGLRHHVYSDAYIPIEKELTTDFTLVIKHFIPFLLNVEYLMKSYRIYGLVRNPLTVLLSMHTLKTMEEGYYVRHKEVMPNTVELIEKKCSKTGKLIQFLSFLFENCLPLLKAGQVIYYEDLISSKGKALHCITSAANLLDENLKNYHSSRYFDKATISEIGAHLLNSKGAFWEYYPKNSVEWLLKEYLN